MLVGMNRFVAWTIGIALIAGCAATPEPVKPPEATPPAEPAEAPPEPEPAVAPKPVPVLTGAAAKEQAQKLLRQAFDSLNDGNEAKAHSELDQVRLLEPDNKQAACLMRGITADPVAVLGRESTAYTVRPGELLGRIAQRALGDVCEFYILARYNQIKVPRSLAAGQVIRIPGKVALAPEATSAKPLPEAVPPEPAPAVVKPPPGPDPAVVKAVEEKKRRALIERHQRNAQAAFRRQDLATSIREWDRVLELDPGNELAQARKQEAIDLSRRLKQIK